MNGSRIASGCIVATLLAFSIVAALNNAAALQQGPSNGQQGIEILTRGPIHEAFAETVTFDPQPGIIAPQAPPAPIEELPPEQRPEGANMTWMSGYWAWDDERNDFLWVSGIWRALPPGRQWVSGYWSQSGQGAQWTSGYWADAQANEVEYLPEPPATVEAGPNTAAPSADHAWLPGSWLWQQNRYVWQPGSWAVGQSDWNWVPAYYVWTPRGYVFVDGYYDYSVARRGLLFAPVYFNSGIYRQAGFSYSPAMAISPAIFGSHLFLRPGYGHYYYGDFYGLNYATAGYSPWFSFNSSRYGYDPFYAQQQWLHRQDVGWNQNLQTNFQNLRANENLRPPRTWADQTTRLASAGNVNGRNFAIAASLDALAKSKDHLLRFQPVDQAERKQLLQNSQAVAQHREQRQKLEIQPTTLLGGAPNNPREFQPTKLKLPLSPVAAAPADRLGKDHTPPQRHEVLKPDLTVVPTPRAAPDKAKSIQPDPRRVTATPEMRLPQSVSPQEAKRESKGPPTVRSNGNSPSEAKATAPRQSKSAPEGRSNEKPSGGSPAKAQGEVKGLPPAKSNGNPQSAPQGKPQGEAKNKSK
jgi:hypothetical protein